MQSTQPQLSTAGSTMKGTLSLVSAVLFGSVLCAISPEPATAQYFGRNKVQYERFAFRVLETPHFRLHFYPEEEEPARDMARMAERWDARLSTIFNHQLTNRKPILLYANQPDFQQTNAVTEQLTEGTGGITEIASRPPYHAAHWRVPGQRPCTRSRNGA